MTFNLVALGVECLPEEVFQGVEAHTLNGRDEDMRHVLRQGRFNFSHQLLVQHVALGYGQHPLLVQHFGVEGA